MAYGRAVSIDLGAGSAVSGAATIGAVPRSGWQHKFGFPFWTASNIVDDTGAATTLDAQLAVSNGGNADGRSADDSSDTWDMFRRGVGVTTNASTSPQLLLRQIPYAEFDIFCYFDDKASSASGDLIRITDGTTSYYIETAGAGRFSGSLVQATSTSSGAPDSTGNYVVFSGLTSADVDISFEDVGGGTVNIVWSGIQIVEVTGGGSTDATAEPGAGSASGAGAAPTVGAGATASPGDGAATGSGQQPGVSAGAGAVPGAGGASGDGEAPSVAAGASTEPGAGGASGEGQAPTASAGASAEPGAGAGTGEGEQPSTGSGADATASPGAGAASGVGAQPSVSADAGTAPGAGSATGAGMAPATNTPRTPAWRTVDVQAQHRTATVPAQNRHAVVAATAARIVSVAAQDRTATVPQIP